MFMAQLQTALAPLAPLFTALDIINVIIDVIKSVATLNPVKIADALKKLPPLIVDLLAIIPQVAIPLMLVGFLDTIILFLVGFNEYLEKTLTQIQLIEASAAYQGTLGAGALAASVACGEELMDNLMASASDGFGPVNSLIGAINALLAVIGLGKFQIPSLTEVTTDNIEIQQRVLSETAEFLVVVRNAIPV
jgi:hypothetical protein